MRVLNCKNLLPIGACLLAAANAVGQQTPSQLKPSQTFADLAVTYSADRAKLAPGDCGCFWLQGGSLDLGVTVYKGLGVAANFTGEFATDITPGVDLSKAAFVVGPRYTFNTSRWMNGATKGHHSQMFVEGLYGRVHAFNSVFPSGSGTTSSAGSSALQVGGGFDVALSHHLGIRALEADYVRTTLLNNGSNTQNDLRLAFGISFRTGKP